MIFFKLGRRLFFSAFFLAAVLCVGEILALAQENTEQSAAITQFENGQNAHERGETATALNFYEKAIQLQPDFPEAEYQRGTILQQLGRDDEAEKAFRRAVELRADWSLPLAKLGALLVRQNNFAAAAEILNKAVELDAANSPALVALAELEINSGFDAAKRQILLEKIKANTDGKSNAPVALWTARALLEHSLNNKNAARASIMRALQIEPNNALARLARGEILLSENDFAAALDDAKFALEKAAEKLPAQLLLSRIYAAEGKFVESLKILDSLGDEQKKLPVVAELRKAVLINGASDAGSIVALEKLLAFNQKNALLLGRLCVLMRTVNPPQALEYCARAAQLEPTNAAHAVGYGAALVQARQFEKAVSVLRQILIVAPDNYTARANLATALYEAKQFAAAITEFNALLEIKPNIPASYFFLATAHDALGNFTEAMAAYQKFLGLAEATQNQLEIDKVKLRLPTLERQIEKGAGKKKART